MAYDSYNVFRKYNSSNPSTYFKNKFQAKIDHDFSLSMSYQVIKIKDRATGTFSDIGARVETLSRESSNDDFKRIILQDIDYEINYGDIFEFAGFRWIAIQPKSLDSANSSSIVQRCNQILKFTETAPITENIIEIDCVVTNKMNELENDNTIFLANGTLNAIMPLDLNSMKIRLMPRPTRFLLGMPDYRGFFRSWEVENIDSITGNWIEFYGSTPVEYYSSTPVYSGTLNVFLKQSNLDRRDNHDIGIAYQSYF